MPNKAGARCIHTAAQRGHVGVVNSIIQKGENVDATTNVRKRVWLSYVNVNKLGNVILKYYY